MRPRRFAIVLTVIALVAAGCHAPAAKEAVARPNPTPIPHNDEVSRTHTDGAAIHLSTNPPHSSSGGAGATASTTSPPATPEALIGFARFAPFAGEFYWPALLIGASLLLAAIRSMANRLVPGNRSVAAAPNSAVALLAMSLMAAGYVWLIVLLWRRFILHA